jgi:vancomycin resistance protein YoaR
MTAPVRVRNIVLALGLMVAAAAGLLVLPRHAPPQDQVISAYTTGLAHRSPGQVENALAAARSLDGAVVPPGGEFSFNQRVGPWTSDRGYRRAPVSYDGELVLATGGGVCQVSTTLYGAALHGGMEVLERHRHFWPANYARPGMDAAVAFPSIDLRFRNPLDSPVRIQARREGAQLVVELLSTGTPGCYSVEREYLAVHDPETILLHDAGLSPGETLQATRGQPGTEVAVYRVHQHPDGFSERSLISVDSYPTLPRVMKTHPPEMRLN